MSNNYIDCELDSKNNTNKMERTPKLKENQMKSTLQTHSKCVRLNEPTPPDLKRIYHEPTYELPILTNEKYRHLDANERAKLMSDYLTKISNIRASLATRSLLMAPRPKPILPSTKCTDSSLLKTNTIETFPIVEESQETEDNQQQKSTYVNRFGRQVKRKVYTEEAEIDAESKTTQNNENHQYEIDDVKITISNVVSDEPKDDESTIKLYTPIKAKKRLPRAERLFENLLKQDEKKQEEEARMAKFEKTLMQADEDLDENHNGITVEQVSTPAGQSNNRKRRLLSLTKDLDKITVVPESSNDDDTKAKKLKDMKKKKNEIECPICNQKYPTNIVEEHASTCGETMQD